MKRVRHTAECRRVLRSSCASPTKPTFRHAAVRKASARLSIDGTRLVSPLADENQRHHEMILAAAANRKPAADSSEIAMRLNPMPVPQRDILNCQPVS